MLMVNETGVVDVLDFVVKTFESGTKEVQGAVIGLTGAALIAYQNKNKLIILSRNVSSLKDSVSSRIYSFFNTKKIDHNRAMLVAALEEYAQLVPAMSDELDPLLIAMIEKQQDKYDPYVVPLLQTLRVDLNDYPELSNDVCAVDEIEQVIKARKEHHAKVLSKITQYLELPTEDDSTQTYNTIKEIKL